MRAGASIALAALSLALSACNCGLSANPEGALCDPGNVCPSGYLCVAGVCHTTGGNGGGTAGAGGAGGTGGAGGAAGGVSFCDGVTCNKPPAAMCMGSTLRTFSGACNPASGDCAYTPNDTTCPNGCLNAQCTGNSCAGVMCTMPPPPTCSGNNVITFALPGECRDGACRYLESGLSCPGACANGACVPPGASFTQVLPRVRHPITAVDQRPGSAGDDVIVVGPAGAASRWNGTQWSTLATGMNGNISSVWYAGTNSAYLVAETGLLRLTAAGVARVTAFPGTSKLVDVHGISDTNLAVVDSVGTVYRLGPPTNMWTTNSAGLMRTHAPYRINGVYLEPAALTVYGARVHAYGACGSPTMGGCVVYQHSDGMFYDDLDAATANFRSGGPSLDTAGETWFGLDVPRVRRHDPSNGSYDSLNTPTGLDGGAVIAIRPSAGVSPGVFVATAATPTLFGHLYRVSGFATAPTVTHLMETVYGYQAVSKTDSSGVIVVDMNTVTSSSTIIRRGSIANEALDVGAEDWVAGSGSATGSVLMNGYGDVALRTNTSATFVVRRIPYAIDAVDVAAGSSYALIAASDGSAWRLPYTSSTYSQLTFTPKADSFTSVCRASDSEWYFAGKGGVLYAYDGVSPRAMTSGTTTSLTDVDCPSPGAAIACGSGVVLRLVNGAWSPLANVPQGTITSCRLVGSQVFIGGPNLFARFANGAWQTLPSRPVLEGLVVKSVNEAYAASGTSVVRFDGTAWQGIATSPQPLVTGFQLGTRIAFVGPGGVVMEGQ